MPGESVWEKLYIVLKNCKILFMSSIKSHQFKYACAACDIIVLTTTKYIIVPGEKKVRKIECLMLAHRFDKLCMYLTVPIFYEMGDLKGQVKHVQKVLAAVSEKIKEIALLVNPYADETNSRAWGKIRVAIG